MQHKNQPIQREFYGLGADSETRRRRGEPIRQMEADFAKVFKDPEVRKREFESHCRSALGPIEQHHAEQGRGFFKLVGQKRDRSGRLLQNPEPLPCNAGFHVTDDQFAVLQKHPEAIKQVLLALPNMSWSDTGRHDVYRIVVGSATIVEY